MSKFKSIYVVVFLNDEGNYENIAMFSNLKNACLWGIQYYADIYPYDWAYIQKTLKAQGFDDILSLLMNGVDIGNMHIEHHNLDFFVSDIKNQE